MIRLWLAMALAAGVSTGALARPKCDNCTDLPNLELELEVQEAVYQKARQFVRGETDYQLIAESPEALQAILEQAAAAAAGGGGGTGGGTAAPVLTVDVNKKHCPMYLVQNGKRMKFKKKRFNKLYCDAVAAYLLAHEKQHQRVCKDKWKAHTQGDYSRVDFVAQDEMVAYWTGIVSLRQSLAALAKQCGWQGSCSRSLDSPVTVALPGVANVPCRAEVERLQYNVRKKVRAIKKAR